MTSKTRPANASGPRAERPTMSAASAGDRAPSMTTARIVGVLFLAAMLTYGPGSGLIAAILDTPDYLSAVAASKMTFTLGAVLMLLDAVVVVGIGVLLFPILKGHDERIALGYCVSRVIEGVLLTLGVISLLSLTTASERYVAGAAHFETLGAVAIQVNDLSYQSAMATLGVGSVFFCYLLYQTKLIPRMLALWGFAGYAVFLAGAVLEIFGLGVGLVLSVPGGLFEVFLGIWLLTKGFNASAIAPAVLPADAAATAS